MKGERWDLDRARAVAQNEGMREVVPWASYQQLRTAEKYLEYCDIGRNWKPEVTWIWGNTGTGKTKMARELLPDAYFKKEGSKWFMGYDGQNCILDDFRDDWFGGKLVYLLSLLDRYEHRVESKGGGRQFKARRIVITSIFDPRACYLHAGREDINQLMRRIDKVIHLPFASEVRGNTTETSEVPAAQSDNGLHQQGTVPALCQGSKAATYVPPDEETVWAKTPIQE